MLASRFLALQKCAKYSVNPVFRRTMAFATAENHGGVGGGNLPCPKAVGNPPRCTVAFILFFGPAFWIPCIAFSYLMHKD